MSHFEIWDRPASSSPIRPGRTGRVFKDGRLFDFGPESVTVARAWPPAAWQKRAGSAAWHAVRLPLSSSGLRLSLSRKDISSYEPMRLPRHVTPSVLAEALFLRQMPAPVRRIAARFPSRRWHVLSVLVRCPGASDLAVSNPALLWALASAWVFHPGIRWVMRSVRSLVKRPQRDALKWLGFGGTESTRRIFRKIAPASLSIPRLLYLRDAIDDQASLKLLKHAPRINAGVIRLVTDPLLRRHVSPNLVAEVAEDRRSARSGYVARLILDVLQLLGVCGDEDTRIAFKSIERLRGLHDDLVLDVANDELFNLLDLELPRPPLPGTTDGSIEPLSTPGEVIREGREQHHCIASYLPRVARGSCYVYRMTRPQRATILLERRFEDVWDICEMSGSCNARLGTNAFDHAHAWVDEQVSNCRYQLPPPPIPGAPDGSITPLLSPAEIVREGHELHHSIAVQLPQVAQGEVFVYRMTWPQRATILLQRLSDGAWEFGRLLGVNYARETTEAVDLAFSWLTEQGDLSTAQCAALQLRAEQDARRAEEEAAYRDWMLEEEDFRQHYWPDDDWFDESMHFADDIPAWTPTRPVTGEEPDEVGAHDDRDLL